VETVYIPIKRLTLPDGKPSCWVLGVGVCPCLKCERMVDYCGAIGATAQITDDDFTPHELCPVWSVDAIRLQPVNVRSEVEVAKDSIALEKVIC
jgi:hypothetical protein